MRLADSPDTSSATYGDALRYHASRERVLGRTPLPFDEADAAETLAQIHGGPRRACAWLRRVRAQLDTWERRS